MADSVTFHFDPVCPWTWLTSRWLLEVADQTGMAITWQAFSLPMLNEGEEIADRHREHVQTAREASRVVQHLADAGRNDDVGRFYEALGTALHPGGEHATHHQISLALKAADLEVEELLAVAGDPAADDAVRVAHDRAAEAVGPDVGSPVLVTGDGHAIFGPIVSPVPRGQGAVNLWKAVELAADCPSFFELKRGRTSGPDYR